MYMTITEGNQEYKFKASAVTNILYKRMFGSDPTQIFQARAKKLNDPKMKADLQKVIEISSLPEDDPKRLEVASEVAENTQIFELAQSLSDFSKQYGYITFVKANNDPKDVNKKLNVEDYTVWLMQFDDGFFKVHSSKFKDLYDKNGRASSVPKNQVV